MVKEWVRHGFAVDGLLPGVSFSDKPGTIEPPEIGIPPPLFRLIANLVKDHEATREKPIESAIRLFEGCAPENQKLRDTLRPIVLQWLNSTEWFMEKTHEPGKVDASFGEGEFRRQFGLFESSLGALVRGFFSTVKELDEILEEANS